MRDSQRQRVYDAGWRLPTRLIGKGSMDDVVEYVDRVVGSNWWRARSTVTVVTIKDGRGRRSGVAYGNTISLPAGWARTEGVVLHELAHLLVDSGGPPHGPDYASTYLALVRRFMGSEAADVLRAAYKEFRVKRGRAPVARIGRRSFSCAGCEKTSRRPFPWRLTWSRSVQDSARFHSKTCAREWVERSIVKTDVAAARRG